MRLYRVRDVPRRGSTDAFTPVGIWYEAEDLPRKIGEIVPDPDASGGMASFAKAGAGKGYLVYGPYTVVPPGKYSAILRMRVSGEGTDGALAEADVAEDKAHRTLVRRELTAKDLAGAPGYRDIRLPFQVDRPREIEFRVLALNRADIWVDYVYILREGQEDPPDLVEAEGVCFRPFRVIEDDIASGGEAVRIGPNEISSVFPFELRRRLPAGRYRVRVGYRIANGKTAAANTRIESQTAGSRVAFRLESLKGGSLGEKVLEKQALMPGLAYREATFEAVLDRGAPVRMVLDYRRSPGIRVDWFAFETLKS
jgi:hypothetical protein